MKIIRNGQEFELTFSELMAAYDEYKLDCMVADVREKLALNSDYEGIKLSDEQIQDIANNAIHNLSKNDNYFEAYWDSVNYTLKECADELLQKFADEKADTLDLFFSKAKMDDMYIEETYPQLIVRDDDDNCWTDGEIYDFVLNECLAWKPDGRLQDGLGAIPQELADTLKNHALCYGVFPEQVQRSVDNIIAGVKREMVPMPGTEAPDWGEKHWGNGR